MATSTYSVVKIHVYPYGHRLTETPSSKAIGWVRLLCTSETTVIPAALGSIQAHNTLYINALLTKPAQLCGQTHVYLHTSYTCTCMCYICLQIF